MSRLTEYCGLSILGNLLQGFVLTKTDWIYTLSTPRPVLIKQQPVSMFHSYGLDFLKDEGLGFSVKLGLLLLQFILQFGSSSVHHAYAIVV